MIRKLVLIEPWILDADPAWDNDDMRTCICDGCSVAVVQCTNYAGGLWGTGWMSWIGMVDEPFSSLGCRWNGWIGYHGYSIVTDIDNGRTQMGGACSGRWMVAIMEDEMDVVNSTVLSRDAGALIGGVCRLECPTSVD